jgi:hypothetical protein
MRCFKFPKGICKEINDLISEVWQGWKEDERKIRWLDLCEKKRLGGLGFSYLEGKYFHFYNFLHAASSSSSSWAWKSILTGKDILRCGIRWRIGQEFAITYLSNP